MPVDIPRPSRVYGNTSEVTIQVKFNISSWNNDPSRHLRRGAARAHDEFIFEPDHCVARLNFINDIARHASALQFCVLIDEECKAQTAEGNLQRLICACNDHVLWRFEHGK